MYMNIGYVTNAGRHSGVGNRAFEIEKRLRQLNGLEVVNFSLHGEEGVLRREGDMLERIRLLPGVLGSKSVSWLRLGRALRRHTAGGEGTFDLFHLTNQTLSFLAGRLAGPTVVTVHDLIEVLEPQNKKAALFNKYLYSGIPRADHIIAVSEYTKESIKERYGISSDRITVIHNGVDDDTFFPIDDFPNTLGYQELRRELKLGDSYPIVLYVGSDHPRKNLPVALEVFAKLKQERPDAVFIKVGEPGLPAGREETLAAADALQIREAVRFIGTVTDERLNELYNIADVFIFPSRFEGFGLPPLQAMAAGLPVVCSNATSLPEVVGSAALTHDPDDVDGLAESLKLVTSDRTEAERLRVAGLARAKEFSWNAAVEQVGKLYRQII